MSNTQIKHIEAVWKQKTTTCNELFDQRKFLEARNGYIEAMVVAETLNANSEDALRANIPFVQVFIISCNNLANTYEELGNLQEAEKILRRSLHFVLHLMNVYSEESIESLHLVNELKRTVLAYSNFCQKKGLESADVVKEAKDKYAARA
jgi:hypothetical protein